MPVQDLVLFHVSIRCISINIKIKTKSKVLTSIKSTKSVSEQLIIFIRFLLPGILTLPLELGTITG